MITIACAADASYLPYCAAMLHELLRHNRNVAVHFLHGPTLAEDALEGLATVVARGGGHFTAHPIVDERLSGLPLVSHISAVTWYRVLLPELLPDERILYLDCDTFVVDDLRPLWELDFKGDYVAAVEGVPAPGDEQWREQLRNPAQYGYFNAGVVLLNLEVMRSESTTERLLSFARTEGDRLRWSDQDTLNVVLGDRRRPLHPRWNCQTTLYEARDRALHAFSSQEIDEAKTNPAILHFEGPGACKPWHFLCDHPWTARYRDALAAIPWAETPLAGRTLQNRLIAATLPPNRRIPTYARLEQYKLRLGLRSEVG